MDYILSIGYRKAKEYRRTKRGDSGGNVFIGERTVT
jgi:hypothetical protein